MFCEGLLAVSLNSFTGLLFTFSGGTHDVFFIIKDNFQDYYILELIPGSVNFLPNL